MPVVVLGAPASVQQYVVPDLNNTSVANLNSAATFTGAWTSTLNFGAIQGTFYATQNCIVYIEQSSDGVNVDVTDSFQYNVAKGNLGTTIQAVAAFFRVRVTNLGAIATTTLRLYSYLCPIAEPLPRSPDQRGNLQTAVYGLSDIYGGIGRYTQLGDLAVEEPYRLVGTTFGSTIDAAFWTATTSGTGATASIVTPGIVTLASPTAGAGYAQITTTRTARYIQSHPHRARCRVRLPVVAVAGTTRIWGAYTLGAAPAVQDGYVWQVDAAGAMTLLCYSGGAVVASAASGTFNGEVSAYTVDTNCHGYDVVYTVGKVQFLVDNILVHTFQTTTTPLSGNVNLPMSADCSGTGTQAKLDYWYGYITRQGRPEPAPLWKNIHGVNAGTQLKLGPGQLRRVVLNASASGTVVSLYDATSATNPIALVTINVANVVPSSFEYGLDFYTGLWVVTANAATDVTFVID